jgi:cell fate regulator YaaT (PSP1 superfamily)
MLCKRIEVKIVGVKEDEKIFDGWKEGRKIVCPAILGKLWRRSK